MRTIKKTNVKLAVTRVVAMLVMFFLCGCQQLEESPGFLFWRMFGVPDGMTETQASWIVVWELILILFLVLLIILLFALFIRYRKTEKQAIESKIRERNLVRENEVLDHLNRTKTEFFQNMSHDFKTPLTVISTSVINAVDLLDFSDFGTEGEEIKESLILAQSEVMRLSRIVDSALKHAALYSNHYFTEQINLGKLLKKIEKTYHVFLERRGNKLVIALPQTLPPVYGNLDMLLNVFSNLITNANRYTQNGQIIVSAEIEEKTEPEKEVKQYISITVKDNGSGVNPDILENIFVRGASEYGSGLGLSICKTAIEAFGGTIVVKSEKGIGTSVTFTVPAYDENSDTPDERRE